MRKFFNTPNNWSISIALVMGATLFVIISFILAPPADRMHEWLAGIFGGLAVEMFGGATIFLLVNNIFHQKEQERIQLREELEYEQRIRYIRDAGSPDNSIAKNATYQLREMGRIEGDASALIEANLQHANLQGANLVYANLYKSNLNYAHLQDAAIGNADLRCCSLRQANLRHAILINANLSEAYLKEANLNRAYVRGANFSGASLRMANLQFINEIHLAIFDEKTILPDAKQLGEDATGKMQYDKYWHKGLDWTPYLTGEIYRGFSASWKKRVGWKDPKALNKHDR